jgi:protein-disulfide isomerase
MPAPPRTELQTEGQPWRGNPNAPIVLVNFADLASRISAHSSRNIQRAMSEYPGKIKWVHRNYFGPLDQNALTVAQFGEWAHEKGKFWEFHAAVTDLDRDVERAALVRVAQKIGLDTAEYDHAEKTQRLLGKVKADIGAAQKNGVTGAPVIFVNGLYFSGTFPYERLKALIDRELANAAVN